MNKLEPKTDEINKEEHIIAINKYLKKGGVCTKTLCRI